MTWSVLHRDDDRRGAERLVITLRAMEFDVRVRHDRPERPLEDWDEAAPPFVIEVPTEDRPHLAEVLEELVREQDEFDARLDLGERRARLGRQIALAVMVLLVLVLGVLRAV